MTTFKTLCIAGFTALILPLGAATPAAADPFDQSHERCNTIEKLSCIVLQQHVTKVYTLGEVVFSKTGRTFEDIVILNGWTDGEVTPETVIPKGKKFALYSEG